MMTCSPSTWCNAAAEHPGQAAVLWAVGTAVIGFPGRWRVGASSTPQHRQLLHPRLASHRSPRAPGLLRRHVLVVLAIISYAMPILRGREANLRAMARGNVELRIMSIGMAVMVLAPERRFGICKCGCNACPPPVPASSWLRKTSWCSFTGCVWRWRCSRWPVGLPEQLYRPCR